MAFPIGAVIGSLTGLLSGSGSKDNRPYLTPEQQAFLKQLQQSGLGQFGFFNNLGQQGANAMAGDPAAIEKMMNPYNKTLDPFWAKLREGAQTDAASEATLRGSFGGSRAAIMSGERLAGIDNAQAAQRYGEYTNAMGRAGQLADLGQRSYGLMQGSLGPTGTSQPSNPWAGGFGGAMTGYALWPGKSGTPAEQPSGANDWWSRWMGN